MKSWLSAILWLVLIVALAIPAGAYNIPTSTRLKGDVSHYQRPYSYNGPITKYPSESHPPNYSLLTLTDMIGDNDGYGYGNEVAGDGDDLPYTEDYGWQFDNRSEDELIATDGAQATDLEGTFDVTFMHRFDFSQFDQLTEAFFTIDISGLQQGYYGGVSRLYLDGVEVPSFLNINQNVWGSGLFNYAVDLDLLKDGALDVLFDNWGNDFGIDDVGIDFTMLTVKGYTGTPIPEPASMILMGLGLAGLGVGQRFRPREK